MSLIAYIVVIVFDRVALGLMSRLQEIRLMTLPLVRIWVNVTGVQAYVNAEKVILDQHVTFGTVIVMKHVWNNLFFLLIILLFLSWDIYVYISDTACSGHGNCVSTARLFELYGLSYGNVTTDYIKPGGPNWDAYRWFHCLCSASIVAGFLGDPYRPSVGPR